MAKAKADVNKSKEIRTVLAENPGAMAKEVVATLKGKGIDVTDALVYAVKQKQKASAETPKATKAPKAKTKAAKAAAVKTAPAKATPAKAAPSSNGALSVGASIAVAKAAAAKVGGWSILKEIVDEMQ